jgi:glutamyl-tRNA synthetase
MSDRPLRLRFAPSPTGFFHVGGARTALYNWAIAQREGGTFVLRIEDTDEARNKPEWTQGIIDALAWIGIHTDDERFEGPYFQSDEAATHVAAATRLHESGHAYYCDLTAEEIQQRSKASGKQGYDNYSRDRGLEPGPGRVLRFRVPDGKTIVHDLVRGEVTFDNEHIEDFVLLRGNGMPMFLLANVVDDMSMRISHVVRAEEHLPNTPKQQMLWEALGEEPPVWAHVPVLVNEQRKKLSKRRDKVAVEQYRAEGYLADAMVNYLMTLGWAPSGETEIVPWSQIVEEFRLEDVNHSPAYFDLKKLAAFNGEYIRALSVDAFIEACAPYLTGDDAPWPREQFNPVVFSEMAALVQTRVTRLDEVPAMVDFLFLSDAPIDDAAFDKVMSSPAAVDVLNETTTAYETAAWDHDSLKETLEAVGEAHGLKLGKAQAPIRVAVTGRTVGPPLFESLVVLGRERDAAPAARRAGQDRCHIIVSADTPSLIIDSEAIDAVDATEPAPPSRRRRVWPWVLLAIVGLGVLYYVITLIQVWRVGDSDQARPVDAIVVMGAAQYDGRPSPQLQARLDHVVELWNDGLAPLVVVTGGNQPGDRFTEASASAKYLVDHGVDPTRSSKKTRVIPVGLRCRPSPTCSTNGDCSACCSSAIRTTRCGSG